MAVSRQQARDVVDVVMDELSTRGGFDHWAGEVTPDVWSELMGDLTDQMHEKLNRICGPHGHQGQ